MQNHDPTQDITAPSESSRRYSPGEKLCAWNLIFTYESFLVLGDKTLLFKIIGEFAETLEESTMYVRTYPLATVLGPTTTVPEVRV